MFAAMQVILRDKDVIAFGGAPPNTAVGATVVVSTPLIYRFEIPVSHSGHVDDVKAPEAEPSSSSAGCSSTNREPSEACLYCLQ